MLWKVVLKILGRSMALLAAAGVGALGVVVAGGYGFYRLFRGSDDAAETSAALQNGLAEERRGLIDSSRSSNDEPDSEESGGEEVNKSEDTQKTEEAEPCSPDSDHSPLPDGVEETLAEPISPSQDGGVPDSGPLPEDRGTYIITPVKRIPQANSTPRTPSTPPAVAPKPKPRSREPFKSPLQEGSGSFKSPLQEGSGSRGPIRNPNAVLVMPPGLAEKIAQRTPTRGAGSRGRQDSVESPASTSANISVLVNGVSGTEEHQEAVSFEEPAQHPKLANLSRNRGPPRRPPTGHQSPSAPQAKLP